jgi:hypothetical protein
MSQITDIPDAVGILIQAARIGQEHGIFTLEEARLIADSIDLILTPQNTSNNSNSSVKPVRNDAINIYNKELDEEGTFSDEDEKPVQRFVDNTIPKIPTAADKLAKGKATSAPYAGNK